MYRFKQGVKVKYDRQGYIYFVSRLYKDLPEEKRAAIRQHCRDCAGEYHKALFEFVTRDTTATAIELKYYISRATLYRVVRRYYEEFPMWI